MRIGWIYPHRERCGIASYARQFLTEPTLAQQLVPVDPHLFIANRRRFLKILDMCDIIHLNYDTAAFFEYRHDFYPALMRSFQRKTVVTVHEVYKELPFIYPRSALKGTAVTKLIRRILYDIRHPVASAYYRHLEHHFYTGYIHVHHHYQASIITSCSPSSFTPIVIPLPVPQHPPWQPWSLSNKAFIELGAFGFLNPSFDYQLLFKVLECLKHPWRFTWVGGVHPDRSPRIFDELNREIARRGWNSIFAITGWVDTGDLYRRLASLDLVTAFFTIRSSSGSIATALAAGRPVIATKIPLTEEIATSLPHSAAQLKRSPILLVHSHPATIAESISAFFEDRTTQDALLANMSEYCDETSLDRTAERLLTLYRSMVTS